METIQYHGHDCVSLSNGIIRLLVTRLIGPRILSFGFEGGANLFASLPDFTTDRPGMGTFHFHGGHRLWHSPEDPSRTYMPDNLPLEITTTDKGLLVTQPTEPHTGLQKSLEICLIEDSARVTITHRLTNYGTADSSLAPWAITMFATGGTAILPQSKRETGVLPNRSLTLWPYTNISNPNVVWGDDLILVHAKMPTAFKIGFPNPRGWLAYWLDGTLFVKHAEFDPEARYYDFGSSSECYCNGQFLELETLAPIRSIKAGETATHIETWELHKGIEYPRDERDAQAITRELGLP